MIRARVEIVRHRYSRYVDEFPRKTKKLSFRQRFIRGAQFEELLLAILRDWRTRSFRAINGVCQRTFPIARIGAHITRIIPVTREEYLETLLEIPDATVILGERFYDNHPAGLLRYNSAFVARNDVIRH